MRWKLRSPYSSYTLEPEGFPSPYLRVTPAPLQIQPSQALLVRDLSGGDGSTMALISGPPLCTEALKPFTSSDPPQNPVRWTLPVYFTVGKMEVNRSLVTFLEENHGQIMSFWFLVFSFQEMLFSVLGVDNCLIATFFCYSTWALLSHSVVVAMTNSSIVSPVREDTFSS